MGISITDAFNFVLFDQPLPAVTAAEQAELRRRVLRETGAADAAEALRLADRLAQKARALNIRGQVGAVDDVALVATVQEAHALRCKLAAIEAGL